MQKDALTNSMPGRAASFIGTCIGWIILALIGLIISIPVCLLLGGMMACIGLHTIALGVIIYICLRDFQTGVADEVIRRQKMEGN